MAAMDAHNNVASSGVRNRNVRSRVYRPVPNWGRTLTQNMPPGAVLPMQERDQFLSLLHSMLRAYFVDF
jgi:hypothetical protein